MNKHALVSDAWTELIQSGCHRLEVEAIQPLGYATASEALHSLKRLWAYSVLCAKPLPSEFVLQVCTSPFAKAHPIARVLAALLLKQIALPTPPLVVMHPLMPFFESCQLALLWAIAGEEKAYRRASQLLPLAELPSLWCKEEEFSEEEMTLSIALLKRAFGFSVNPPEKGIDPFFFALAKCSPQWEPPSALPHRIFDPEMGLLFQRGDRWVGAMTLAGEGTSLGAFSAEGVEIRALGPQIPPLSQPKGFGILRLPDSQPIERWTAVAGAPEVWMEAKVQFERDEAMLAIRFLGQGGGKSLHFSFYIKAAQCQVGEEVLFPRTLKRYQGEAQPVLLGVKIKLNSLLPGKMEVIPLAGEEEFWGSDFLITFEIPSFEGRGEYRLEVLAESGEKEG